MKKLGKGKNKKREAASDVLVKEDRAKTQDKSGKSSLLQKWKQSGKKTKVLTILLLVLLIAAIVLGVTFGKKKDAEKGTLSAKNAEVNLLDGTETLGLSQGGQQFGFYPGGTYKAAGFLILENETYSYETSGTYQVKNGKLTFTESKPVEVTVQDKEEEWESAVSSVIYQSNWTVTLTGTDKDGKTYTLAQYDLGKEEAEQLGVKGVTEVEKKETTFFDVEENNSDLSSLLSGLSMEDLAAMMGMSSFASSGTEKQVEQYDTSGALVAVEQQGITLAFYQDGTYTLSGTATYEGQKISLSQKDTYTVKDNNLVFANASPAVVSADMLKQYGMDNMSVNTAHNCINKNGTLTVNIVFSIPSYGNQTLGSYTISATDAAKLGVTGASSSKKDPTEKPDNNKGQTENAFVAFFAGLLQWLKKLF